MPKKVDWSIYTDTKHLNNQGEEYTIIKAWDARMVQIVWTNTGSKMTTRMDKIKQGNLQDPIYKGTIPSRQISKIGFTRANLRGLEYCVIAEKMSNPEKLFLCLFKNTNTTIWASSGNVDAGKVRDNYSKTVCGVGYLGDFDKNLEYALSARKTWSKMITRCYSTNINDSGMSYADAHVSTRWHSFENFLRDISMIENFEKWEKDSSMELDKDKISKSKVYSLDTCVFLTRAENMTLVHNNI